MSDSSAPVVTKANGLIVIPARFGSSRLPGKPLLKLAGRTLLERVTAVARKAAELDGGCDVVVATDDTRIADHASSLGVDVALTPAELDSGSARAYAAASARSSQPAFVINLQGDAPFVSPAIVAGLMNTLRGETADVATAVYQLDWERLDRLRAHKISAPFSGTTCVRGSDKRALWFSKTILPAIREEKIRRSTEAMSPVWQHLGLYGYTMAALEWFASTAPTPYERLEGLEQLRFLESGKIILTVEVDPPEHAMSGIDTPADLALAEAAIDRLGDPFPD